MRRFFLIVTLVASATLLNGVRTASSEDGTWIHGCVLSTPLAHEELQGWVTGHTLTAQS